MDDLEMTSKLFAISAVSIGDMVSRKHDGPYRKVADVEKYAEHYSVRLEPISDEEPEYLDVTRGDLLWIKIYTG